MSNPSTPPPQGEPAASTSPSHNNSIVPSTPSPTGSSTPVSGKKRVRGNYNCGKCGLQKRGHVCNLSGTKQEPDTPTKTNANPAPTTPPPTDQNVYATMYSSQGMISNSTTNGGGDSNNEVEALKNEIEDLKKVVQFLQQQNNDMRTKLYTLSAMHPNGLVAQHTAELVNYKAAGIEIPDYGAHHSVDPAQQHNPHAQHNPHVQHHPQQHHPQHHPVINNNHPASDLNELSNVAQQIGDTMHLQQQPTN